MRVLLDASTVVGAVLKVDSVPRQALIAARERHTLVLSGPVMAEIAGVVRRPKFARAVTEETREGILAPLAVAAVWAEPITDCWGHQGQQVP